MNPPVAPIATAAPLCHPQRDRDSTAKLSAAGLSEQPAARITLYSLQRRALPAPSLLVSLLLQRLQEGLELGLGAAAVRIGLELSLGAAAVRIAANRRGGGGRRFPWRAGCPRRQPDGVHGLGRIAKAVGGRGLARLKRRDGEGK